MEGAALVAGWFAVALELASAELPDVFRGFGADVRKQLHFDAAGLDAT